MQIICNDKRLTDLVVMTVPTNMGYVSAGNGIPPHSFEDVIRVLENCGSHIIQNVRYDLHARENESYSSTAMFMSPTDVMIIKDADDELENVGYIIIKTKDGAHILALPKIYRNLTQRTFICKNVLSEWEGPKWSVRMYA